MDTSRTMEKLSVLCCFRNTRMFFILLMRVLLLTGASSIQDLYLIGLYPFHGAWHGGAAMLAASQLALDQVNSRDDVLPGYKLNLLWNDTWCNPGLGLNIMFHHLYTPPTKIMIIGDSCSIVSEATAQVSFMWNVVQISPGSTSPALSDKTRFKLFLRTNSPETDVNPVLINLFQEFGWSTIATIHQDYPIFSVANDDLIQLIKQSNMTRTTSEIIANDPALQIRKLKESGARIIVGSFYADMAIKVFCEAFRIGLYGPKIVWILKGWYSKTWWKTAKQSLVCSLQDIEKAIDGYISVDRVSLNPKPDVMISGFTAQEIHVLYRNKTNYEDLPSLKSGLKGYDAIWTAALALNQTAADLDNNGTVRLEDFTYDNKDMADLLYQNALKTEFMGTRGWLSFNKNGDLKSAFRVDRLQGGENQMVGLYYPKNKPGEKIEWSLKTPIVWKGGQPPKDSLKQITITEQLPPSLYIAVCFTSGAGIFLTCVFLTFNIYFRKTRLVKMSSPNLNNLTLAGCLVLYGTVFLESADPTTIVIFCEAKILSFAVGFSLAFGGLFAKTWRVYIIFTHGKQQRKIVKDKQLLLTVLFLVTLNVSIIIIWFVIDPLDVVTYPLISEINTKDDIEINKQLKHCQSSKQIYFISSELCVQGILLLFGVFLALQTRKVKVDGLNDSKMIGFCIYNVIVLSFLGVTVSFALRDEVDLNYGITSCIIILATTVTQCLIIVPKITAHFSKTKVGAAENAVPTISNMTSASRINPTPTSEIARTSLEVT